ncbi:hypothetical protein ACVWZ4_002506 [Bradyrhizobium sp. USDA 4472]
MKKGSIDPQLIDERLYPRDETSFWLGGCSIAELRRLERSGALNPIRRNKRSPTAQVFYTGANIRKVIRG